MLRVSVKNTDNQLLILASGQRQSMAVAAELSPAATWLYIPLSTIATHLPSVGGRVRLAVGAAGSNHVRQSNPATPSRTFVTAWV